MKLKSKFFLTLFTTAALLLPTLTQAQTAAPAPAAAAGTTNAVDSGLKSLIQQVMVKIKAGKKKEADFTDELKGFDDLVAQVKGAKTDEVAQIVFMKAMLYLQIFNDTDKGKAILADLKATYPDTKAAKNVDKVLASMDKQSAAKKIQDALTSGATFPDFSETDLAGKPISVAALKSKVVMIDFWATWCAPCRGELPNVIATYKKHHADGFEIIGVSLDSDRDKLDTFLKQQDGMTWAQFFDGQGWGNKLAVKYGVEAIPFTILVGPDGKIIDTNLRGEELEKAVADALAKK
ncbi:MAG TPA: TlpA disulfide reductase family protein [Verrucomicrobiae bacterium]